MPRGLLALLTAIAMLAASVASAAETPLPLPAARSFAMTLDEGTWISLDLSPDGSTIVFDLLGDLYSLDVAGGQARLLTRGMAFDAQPKFSPDGKYIAFVSDRSGNDNLWIANADGKAPRQLSTLDDNTVYISPAWSADGRQLYVTRFRSDSATFELWRYELAGGPGQRVTGGAETEGQPRELRGNALGATASSDGHYIYYAAHTGYSWWGAGIPPWKISRRDLRTGEESIVLTSAGGAFRPVLSPDGRSLAYATRHDGETGLRLRDLASGADRWITGYVQRDQQEAHPTRDLIPSYAFAPDGKALIVAYDGKIRRIDVASGQASVIPFKADVSLDIGPSQRVDIEDETGPIRARLIQAPSLSPDGRWLAYSAFGRIHVTRLATGATRRLTDADTPEFQPSWSPDGHSLVYVSWTARGGHIWRASLKGGAPKRLTNESSYYTDPVFTPDGKMVVALHSSNYARMQLPLEYGSFRPADIVRLPASGGDAQQVGSGTIGGTPHFTDAEPDRVYLYFQGGLGSLKLDGSDKRMLLEVKAPGYYFQEGLQPVDDLRLSPDGKSVLAQSWSQLYLLAMPIVESGPATIELHQPSSDPRRLTTVGADFFGWADGGRTITWAIGSTWYRRTGNGLPERHELTIMAPHDVPQGAVVLRGGTAITMKGDELIEDADVVVAGGRILGVGPRGTTAIPPGAEIRDVSGKYLLPGFIDTHIHWGYVRRGVLDLEHWGFQSFLGYGVTTGLDPSSLSIDIFAYRDLIDAGLMLGPRAFSTGPAVFSFNDFQSRAQVVDVLSRYRDHYRTRNLKQYRVGNRRQRQWVADVAAEMGLLATTEGALDLKLDLTQVMDGFAGHEHALPAVPLGRDVIELLVQNRTSYTPTLLIGNGGPPAANYFITRSSLWDDPKANRFIPREVLAAKTFRLPWYELGEYLFPRLGADAARIQRAGGLVGIGSHGEVDGLSYHWELQALALGGMTAREILQAATIGSAEVIGRRKLLGSLEPGKYADLLVLDADPLADIRNAQAIGQVMKNGRLYDARTLDEIWPRQRPAPRPWFLDDQPVAVPRP
jgi:Tol biopolymer transport system component